MWPILSIICIVIISKSIISKVIKSNVVVPFFPSTSKYLLDINFILNVLQEEHGTNFYSKE
jgi:hypothetical protein